MKIIIFIISIYFSFCQIYELKKRSYIYAYSKTGLVYLNIKEFKMNNEIHIKFTAQGGSMNELIEYEFSDDVPKTKPDRLSKTKNPIYYGDEEYTYDIKKKEDTNFLLILYSGYSGEYLKIDNTLINWDLFFCILIFANIVVCFSGCTIYACILRCIKKRKEKSIESTNNGELMPYSYN